MLLREVAYAKPSSLAEALEIARGRRRSARSGGRADADQRDEGAGRSPDALVDLSGLDELKGIELGATGRSRSARWRPTRRSWRRSEARARPILGEVCAQIADVQVRNRGTIGGNVCTNDPTNHLPPLLAALGARFTIAGGERRAHRVVGRLLPRRLPDRGRHRRAADEGHDPGRPSRRLRRRHARRGGDVHRERGGFVERSPCALRSAASTRCRSS